MPDLLHFFTTKIVHISSRMAIEVSGFRKRRRCTLERGATLHPTSRIENNQARTEIVIGADSHIHGQLLTFGHGGRIEIGRKCYIGENSRIWSALSIRIGDRVVIAHGVNIHDTNSHSLSPELRAKHIRNIFDTGHPAELPDVASREIVIGDDVWIGFGCTLLKGVEIGRGAIVGACSIITNNVPPYTMVAGNPARILRELR